MGADFISHTRGVINMYGVFQTFYQSHLLEHQSASNISWVGSIQAFLIFLGGAVVGPFFDLGYLRLLLSLGTFSTYFGMMMTSVCKTYWQFVLAQGVTVGIGFGCLFLPSVAIVSQYFTTKKSIAFGIVSTGGIIGESHESHTLRINKKYWLVLQVVSSTPSFSGSSSPRLGLAGRSAQSPSSYLSRNWSRYSECDWESHRLRKGMTSLTWLHSNLSHTFCSALGHFSVSWASTSPSSTSNFSHWRRQRSMPTSPHISYRSSTRPQQSEDWYRTSSPTRPAPSTSKFRSPSFSLCYASAGLASKAPQVVSCSLSCTDSLVDHSYRCRGWRSSAYRQTWLQLVSSLACHFS